jgi:hypothetical protein
MLPKPSKEHAIRYIQNLLPEYGEMLSEIEKNGGWIRPRPKLEKALQNLKITDYAKFYAIENIMVKSFIVAVFDQDAIKQLSQELEQATDQERTAFLDDWIETLEQTDDDDWLGFKFPETPEEEAEALKLWETLNEEERAEASKRSACFLVFFMINFHNYLSIMVHGRKITQLITEALQGNDESFVLAVQIDPSVMQSIPYFQERENRARSEGNIDFLDKLAYRRRIPPLQGKIRFRLLYLLFAILESMNLLNDLSHSEILDICDESGLDRWQNRIEDINYLTKRLREYRRFQLHKPIHESMH